MRVLIIEDEPLVQEELVRLITQHFAQMSIVAIIDSVADSIEWLSSNRADLIFMDIHLSDGVAFDIFDSVELQTPIIFTTAYDKYAIRAFEVNGVGYILKPIDDTKLVAALERFYKYMPSTTANITELVNQLRQPHKTYKSRIAIKLGDRISHIAIEEIAYFYSEDRVTFAVQKSGKKHIVDYNIEMLEAVLDPMNFFRITRGCVASIASIDKVSKYFNSRLKITLNPEYDKEMLISRVNVPKFIAWLDGE